MKLFSTWLASSAAIALRLILEMEAYQQLWMGIIYYQGFPQIAVLYVSDTGKSIGLVADFWRQYAQCVLRHLGLLLIHALMETDQESGVVLECH